MIYQGSQTEVKTSQKCVGHRDLSPGEDEQARKFWKSGKTSARIESDGFRRIEPRIRSPRNAATVP